MAVNANDPFQRDAGATDEKTLRVVLSSDSPGASTAGTVVTDGTVVRPSTITLTDRSGTSTGATQQIAPALAGRRYLCIMNISDTAMYINFTSAAAASNGSFLLVANGGSFTMESGGVSGEAVNLFCASAAKAFTCKEA